MTPSRWRLTPLPPKGTVALAQAQDPPFCHRCCAPCVEGKFLIWCGVCGPVNSCEACYVRVNAEANRGTR
jgi:hypothetical protein